MKINPLNEPKIGRDETLYIGDGEKLTAKWGNILRRPVHSEHLLFELPVINQEYH